MAAWSYTTRLSAAPMRPAAFSVSAVSMRERSRGAVRLTASPASQTRDVRVQGFTRILPYYP